MLRIEPDTDWEGQQEQLYLDDYDVVCLGSPIVAGEPMQIVTKALGGSSSFHWRRNAPTRRRVIDPNEYRPLGVVFATYGGSIYGSKEAIAALERMKLSLNMNNVDVAGTFACCGRDFGPANLTEGQKPKGEELADPLVYETADGGHVTGSFFHHARMWEKPGPRDEAKAKALIADLVEDYFLTNDGERRFFFSEYISIS